jgi:hypothetical protein
MRDCLFCRFYLSPSGKRVLESENGVQEAMYLWLSNGLKKFIIRKKQAEKNSNLSTVIIVCLEEDRKFVFSWLASNFFYFFKRFVFVEVDSIDPRIFHFKVINSPVYVNSRSPICGLKNKNNIFLNYVSNLQKFSDSVPSIFFKFPDSGLVGRTFILSAEQQHCSIFESNKAVE